MRNHRIYMTVALVFAGVVSTLGSGGGGGSGGSFDPYGGPYPPMPIRRPSPDFTIANAQAIAATVVRNANQTLNFAATIGAQISPSLPSAPDLFSSHSKFELFATVAATGEPVTGTCGTGGTVTVTGYPENDPASLSVEDAFDLTFTDCDDGDGYSIDGSFSLIVVQLNGDLRTDVFKIDYDLQSVDVEINFDDDTKIVSRDSSRMELIWDSIEFPVTVFSARPYVLHLTSETDVYSLFNVGVHSQTVSADSSDTTTLVDIGETKLSSHSFFDLVDYKNTVPQVNYKTIFPLRFIDGQDPESGEILISQVQRDGTIRIVIESSASVRLDIDKNGDGNIDDTQFTTWTALQSI